MAVARGFDCSLKVTHSQSLTSADLESSLIYTDISTCPPVSIWPTHPFQCCTHAELWCTLTQLLGEPDTVQRVSDPLRCQAIGWFLSDLWSPRRRKRLQEHTKRRCQLDGWSTDPENPKHVFVWHTGLNLTFVYFLFRGKPSIFYDCQLSTLLSSNFNIVIQVQHCLKRPCLFVYRLLSLSTSGWYNSKENLPRGSRCFLVFDGRHHKKLNRYWLWYDSVAATASIRPMRLRHSSRHIATHPLILWIELGANQNDFHQILDAQCTSSQFEVFSIN